MMLTPLKNNEFQVTTTNQFSYLPYQQNLLNCNNLHQKPSGPFARTNKLRQNFNKRGFKSHAAARPKSVDFEVLQSLENICRCQPIAYASGLMPLGARGHGHHHGGVHGCEGVPVLDGRVHHLRASQREKHGGGGHEHHHMMAGEWTNLHATRV